MNQGAVRLYVNPGCPWCAQAEKFLRTEQIPGDMVLVGNDPILVEGIKKFTDGEKVSTPVLVSYLTNEVVVGWRPEKYVEIADHIASERRRQSLAPVVEPRIDTNAAAGMAEATPPAPQRVN